MSRSGLNSGTNKAVGTGSLSAAVSSLVRAQYGLPGAATQAETTTDLDKHVADLLLLEAKEREARSKASNSLTSWYFSDDEDGGSGEGKQYKTKTNKRFLKNILRGVEEHNAPLRRREGSDTLEEIRARERKARESRLGVRDSERLGKRDGSVTSPSSSNAAAATAPTSSSRGRNTGPGFAARMLANGLSGALSARESRTREDRQIRSAVEDARSRAERDERSSGVNGFSDKGDLQHQSRSDVKGKGVENRQQDETVQYRDRGSRRHRSRSVDRDNNSLNTLRRHSPHKDSSHYSESEERSRARRSRSRSHSPRRREREDDERRSSRRESSCRTSSTHNRSKEYGTRRRERSHSRERMDRDRSKRHRRKDSSKDSLSSLSDHLSEASSDTFIDYTGADDAVGTSTKSATGSKMDKYFSSSYNPALDINVNDLEDPKTGLIGEGNFSEWDKMLHTLKQRKEDKVFGVTRAREEERERQLRKLERRRKREERELRHAVKHKEKKKKKRKYRSDSGSRSDDSIGARESTKSKTRKSVEPGTVVIDGFEYGKKGSTRAWDMGKE